MRVKNIILTITAVFMTACIPQQGGGGSGGGSMLTGIIPFVLIFVLFYLLILRPQQKQTRERENMIKNIKRGDNVLTNGGIYGKITNVNADILSVEIAKGINVKMTRNGIAALANPEEEDKKS